MASNESRFNSDRRLCHLQRGGAAPRIYISQGAENLEAPPQRLVAYQRRRNPHLLGHRDRQPAGIVVERNVFGPDKQPLLPRCGAARAAHSCLGRQPLGGRQPHRRQSRPRPRRPLNSINRSYSTSSPTTRPRLRRRFPSRSPPARQRHRQQHLWNMPRRRRASYGCIHLPTRLGRIPASRQPTLPDPNPPRRPGPLPAWMGPAASPPPTRSSIGPSMSVLCPTASPSARRPNFTRPERPGKGSLTFVSSLRRRARSYLRSRSGSTSGPLAKRGQ